MGLKTWKGTTYTIRPGEMIEILQDLDERNVRIARGCKWLQGERRAYHQGRAAMAREIAAGIPDAIVRHEDNR